MFDDFFFFFFNDTATTEIYPLSLHDALPIWLPPHRATTAVLAYAYPFLAEAGLGSAGVLIGRDTYSSGAEARSEEHTSELQSPCNLVCRLLLGKKKTSRHNLIKYYTTSIARV